MVNIAGGWPPPVGGTPPSISDFPPLPSSPNSIPKTTNPRSNEVSFAETITQTRAQYQDYESLRKDVTIHEGIPHVKWTEEEVHKMNQIERLQFAVVGKFTYDWSDLEELRKIIPQQCGVKGGCQIGLFRSKHILIRLSLQEDFVNLVSKGDFYITCKDGYSYLMRTLIYDSRFKVNEETSLAMAWISFPNLLPTYFVKECLFFFGIRSWKAYSVRSSHNK